MILKVLKYSCLFIAIFLWIQAYSPVVYRTTGPMGFFPDDYRNGDLYRLSYLPEFKDPVKTCKDSKVSSKTTQKPVHLYILGDSFTEPGRVDSSMLKADKYTYLHWANSSQIKLDTNYHNILILESVERTAREHFSEKVDNYQIIGHDTIAEVQTPQLSWKRRLFQKSEEFLTWLFPAQVEERLQHTLFNYDFFLTIREAKASFNEKVFGRVESGVVLSPDKQALFYRDEAKATEKTSSFYPLEAQEVNKMVEVINRSVTHYQSAGFDQVVLALIPNKVSVTNPELGNYNHLIEKIQYNPNLKVPYIEIFRDFNNLGKMYYLKGDSHWNCEGKALWLSKVNAILQ